MPDEAHENHSKQSAGVISIQTLGQVFSTLVETFGWPGTLAILGFWFVVWYATAEQKQRIIEVYVLGSGIGRTWPILILSVVFAGTALAQRAWYKRRIRQLAEEVEREGKAKSKLQEKVSAKRLQHAESTIGKPKRR